MPRVYKSAWFPYEEECRCSEIAVPISIYGFDIISLERFTNPDYLGPGGKCVKRYRVISIRK